jgi:hypothetical protein
VIEAGGDEGGDDDDDDGPVRRCGACGRPAPLTSTPHTLIGKQHGWRLVRTAAAEGRIDVTWRCPGCFAKQPKP